MEYKIIYGSKGEIIVVDVEDYEKLNNYNWNCFYYYPRTFKRSKETGKLIGTCMHNIIMSISSKETFVDHINNNPLDNRKENLRLCSPTQNGYNRKLNKNNTIGYKGVTWHKRDKRFQASIKVAGKKIHLGYFKNAEDAAEAYNKAAIKYFAEFAKLNE